MAIDDNDKDQPTPSETSSLTVMVTTPNFVGVCEGSPTIRKGIERKIQLPVETILARWIYICIFMKNNSPKYIYIYIYTCFRELHLSSFMKKIKVLLLSKLLKIFCSKDVLIVLSLTSTSCSDFHGTIVINVWSIQAICVWRFQHSPLCG